MASCVPEEMTGPDHISKNPGQIPWTVSAVKVLASEVSSGPFALSFTCKFRLERQGERKREKEQMDGILGSLHSIGATSLFT